MSISFRWIPNFYVGEKAECDIRRPCWVSRRQSLNSLVEGFLRGKAHTLEPRVGGGGAEGAGPRGRRPWEC